MGLRIRFKLIVALNFAAITTIAIAGAKAAEFGAGLAQMAGVTLGSGSAGTPPPGIYMFNQFLTYQAKVVGPNIQDGPKVQVATAATGFLFVPGWSFLGASYSAVVVAPVSQISAGGPVNSQRAGIGNTLIVPIELSWRLGDSGFFIKTGFGVYVPTGTISGPSGLDSIGLPWWQLQPGLVISYLKDGWNFTANMYAAIPTKNMYTGYQTGTLIDVELSATKTIGKWRMGAIGYYMAQITDDKSSAYYGYAVSGNRYSKFAAGALIGYNFGPATLNFWALKEFVVNASGGSNPLFPGFDTASTVRGFSVFTSLNYRLWAPEDSTRSAIRPTLFR